MPHATDFSEKVSRRTVAKAAAWSAPVILASVATPALAASSLTGSLTLSAGSFALVSQEERTITGTILTQSGVQPANLALKATVTGTLTIMSAPVVTGPGTFSLKVKAPVAATTGVLTVQSTNYPQYAAASAKIETANGGIIIEPDSQMQYALVPLANNWTYSHTEDGIRYYSQNDAYINAVQPYFLDLRSTLFSGTKTAEIPDNLGVAPWGTPTKVPGTPGSWGGRREVIVITTVERISSPSRGELTNDVVMQAIAIKTTLGTTSGTGRFATTGSVTMPMTSIPTQDAAGKTVNAKVNGFYLSAPQKPTAAQGGDGLSITAVTKVFVVGPQGQQVGMAYRYNYMWYGIK